MTTSSEDCLPLTLQLNGKTYTRQDDPSFEPLFPVRTDAKGNSMNASVPIEHKEPEHEMWMGVKIACTVLSMPLMRRIADPVSGKAVFDSVTLVPEYLVTPRYVSDKPIPPEHIETMIDDMAKEFRAKLTVAVRTLNLMNAPMKGPGENVVADAVSLALGSLPTQVFGRVKNSAPLDPSVVPPVPAVYTVFVNGRKHAVIAGRLKYCEIVTLARLNIEHRPTVTFQQGERSGMITSGDEVALTTAYDTIISVANTNNA